MAIRGFTSSSPTSGSSRPDVIPNVPDIYRAVMEVRNPSRKTIIISTPLPQNYAFSMTSEFNNPFNQPLLEAVPGGGAIETGIRQAGYTTMNRWMSGASWTGSSEFSIDVPFVLQAFSEPREEVVRKMRDLLKLVAPDVEGEMLKTPGPYVLSSGKADLGGDNITISIGKFFKMSPCVITSVTEDFDTQMDYQGLPIGAVVRIQFKSFWTCTKLDLDKFFMPGLGNT